MHEQITEGDDPREWALQAAVNRRLPTANGPHVWVGSVADYEAAQPTGRWLSANQSAVSLEEKIEQLVRCGQAATDDVPRWAVFAQHGFGRHPPNATDGLPQVVELARRAQEDVRAFHAWANLGTVSEAWLGRFYDTYLGRFDRFQDWLNLEVDRAGWDRLLDRVIPSELRLHVELNLESLEHDLRASGAVLTAADPATKGVFVFANRNYTSSI